MSIAHCNTALLRVAYLHGGPADGVPVLLLHGWPDDATTFNDLAPALQRAGYRTFSPWLRGFGGTSFLSEGTMRSGEIAAMAQDVLELADALRLERFAVVGHDWGARIAYLLAAVFPERLHSCVVLSVNWRPGPMATPDLPQARAYWYQWFMGTERGAEVVRTAGKTFARFMWDTWSPPGWFDDAAFETVAESFANPDWAAVTLHSYRVRWGAAPADPHYADLTRRQLAATTISVPTLMIHGEADLCLLPSTSADNAQYFSGPYERTLLKDVGHFPLRESPQEVSRLVLEFLRRTAGGA